MSVPLQPDRPEFVESDGLRRRESADEADQLKSTLRVVQTNETEGGRPRRILFLDDDIHRAEIFLGRNPDAVWIQTAHECIARLAESWDEVYLDHDLGGEHYVDVEREDCGMEVVRWLCKEPREHLLKTHFIIHSHNLAAALMMVLLMRETGYPAEFLPFGFNLEMDPFSPEQARRNKARLARRNAGSKQVWYQRFLSRFLGILRLSKKNSR